VIVGAQVFISYSSKDSKVARAICSALESRGLPCWISSRDVGLGDNFMDAIVRAISAAKVMVLVFSENANNSDDMKREIVLASSAMVTVIPVRVEDVVPKGAFAYQLATRQWIDLFQDWEDQIERLAKWIATATAATSNAQASAAPVIPLPDRPAIDTDPRPQEETQRLAGEETQRKKDEADAQRIAEENRRQQAEAERLAQEEKSRRQMEVEARQRAEEERLRHEADAKRRADQEQAYSAAKLADAVSAMDKFLAAYPDSHLAGGAKALRATLIARDETKPAAAGLPRRDLYKGEDGPQATVAPPPKTETGPGTLSEVPDPHITVQPPNERPTITAPPIVPTPPNGSSVAPPPVHAATAAKRSPLLIGGVVAAVLAVVGVIAILNSSGPGQPETHSTATSPAPSTTTSETPSKATDPAAAWLIQQGDSARAQGNIEQAISDYDMAQQVDPSSGGMEKAAELRQGQNSGGGGDNTGATMNNQALQNLPQGMPQAMQDMLKQLMNQNAPSPPETK
jgi:hypothetical protein